MCERTDLQFIQDILESMKLQIEKIVKSELKIVADSSGC